MNHRVMLLVAAFAAVALTITLVPTNASAQQRDAGVDAGARDAGAAPMVVSTPSAVPACGPGHVIACVCPDGQHEDASGVCVANVARVAPPEFCIMSYGVGDTAEAGRRCHCSAGKMPIEVLASRSVDRLQSLGVPRGHRVFVCSDSLALRGTPGSPDERVETLIATLTTHDAALRALCGGPGVAANTDLVTLCAEARTQFLAAGSTTGPVDLGPVLKLIEDLTTAAEAEHALVEQLVTDSNTHTGQIADNVTRTEVISHRVDALTQCLQYGVAVRLVTYTDQNGVTQTQSCREFLAANRRQVAEIIRHEVGDGGRGTGPHSFILFQAFGDLAFTQLRYGNTDYGLPRSAGVELTLGIGLGGAWNIQFGGALGGAWPNVPGVTNVFVMPSIGFAHTKPINRDVHWSFGFGGLAGLRFLPDGSLAHNVYAPYVEGLFRFGAQHAWSPVLDFRLYAGVAPHAMPNGTYAVPFTAGAIIGLGFGHF